MTFACFLDNNKPLKNLKVVTRTKKNYFHVQKQSSNILLMISKALWIVYGAIFDLVVHISEKFLVLRALGTTQAEGTESSPLFQ